MKLLLQRPIPGGPPIERIIARVCGPYCHSEIQFERDGCMFSSGAPKGVRFTSAEDAFNDLTENAAYWDIIGLPWTEPEELIAWCESEVGAGYDYVGAFSSGFGLARQHPSKWFCSEICAEVISRASGIQIPSLLCPTNLGIWINEVLDGTTDPQVIVERQIAAIGQFQASDLDENDDYRELVSLMGRQLTSTCV